MKRWLFLFFAILLFAVRLGAADTLTSGSCSAGTTSSAGCSVITVSGFGTVGIQVTGTFSGTLSFEATNDDTTWVAVSAYKSTDPTTAVTTTTTTGLYSVPVAGLKRVRVRFSAFSTGSAVVTNIKSDARLWSPGGGSGTPFGPGNIGEILTTSVSSATPQPTFAQVLAVHPEITPTWAAETDLAYGDDVVVCVNGGGKAFCGELLSGDLTGAMEPTWGSFPDAGDEVSDGDDTWIATGKTWATFLATTPTTWTANHDYSPDVSSPVLVWPTTPNGHLYFAYPLALTSDSSEPDFGTVFGGFTQDNDGYWMDAGGVPNTVWKTVFDALLNQDLSVARFDATYNGRSFGIGAARIFFDAGGDLRIINLPTTGLSGKKVLCIDSATGDVYVSATGVDCSD